MGSEGDTWISMTVGDLVTLNYGESLPERKRKQGKIPVYGSNGITGYHDQALVPGPGIIVGRKGTSGAVHYCKSDYFPIDTTFYITPSENYDLIFVYYLLKTLELDKLNFDSAVPGLNRNTAYSIPIKIPQKQEQQKIASILGALDDKIELNHEMNRTLEAMAQAIFKSWFVDFEFQNEESKPYRSSGGEMVYSEELQLEIPKGWEVGKFDQIVDIVGGGTPKTSISEYWNGDIHWVSARDVSNTKNTFILETERAITKRGVENSSTKILDKGTTIITARGTVGECAMLGRDMAMNQTCYGLIGKGSTGPFFTYLATLNLIRELKQCSYGTVFDTITTKTFKEQTISIPPNSTFEIFGKKVLPIFEQILTNAEETLCLAKIRDILLPKLLSGGIRVNSIAENRNAQKEAPA